MRVRCISDNNGLFRAVTVNSIYTVLEETRDFYIITNNNGISARYSRRFFEVVADDVVAEQPVRNGARVQAVQAAPRPAVRVRRTNQDIIDSIVVDLEFERGDNGQPFSYASNTRYRLHVNVKYNIAKFVGDDEDIVSCSFTVHTIGTEISCGIGQIINIGNIDVFYNTVVDYQEDDYDGVREAIFEQIKLKFDEHACRFISTIIASHTLNNHNDGLGDAMALLGFESKELSNNPNSDNIIVLYTKTY